MPRLLRRLIPLVLVIAALAALVFPTSALGAPIDDKKAQAAEIEAQINANGQKLGALNEQINDAQIKLDAATDTIAAADAAVDAAKAKTAELRGVVAQRAASVYMRSGTEGGVAQLDAGNANELSQRQKYASVAAQRDERAVYQLKQAQEDLAVRKADAETARTAADTQKQQIEAKRSELSAGDAKQRAVARGRQRRDRRARSSGRTGTSGTRRVGVGGAAQGAGGRRAGGRHRHVIRWWRQHGDAAAVTERWRRRGDGLRLRAARQALLLRRCRPRLLRLLGPHDDGVGASRRVHVARVVCTSSPSFPRGVHERSSRSVTSCTGTTTWASTSAVAACSMRPTRGPTCRSPRSGAA